MSKVMPITVVAAAMLAAAPDALAQEPTTRSPWPNVRRDTTVASPRDTGTRVASPRDTGTSTALADSASIRQAISGNLLEVRLGQVGQSRAADSAVKQFAQRMLREHASAHQQWTTLARNRGLTTDTDLGPAGERSIERLEDLSGAAFDQAYMAEMIRRHEQDLAAFQRMGTSARSPDVRQLANSGVSSIRDHLAVARQVGSRVGVSPTAARTGAVTDRVPQAERDDRDDRNVRGTLRAEDRTFVQEVLQDHLMHIRLAERAQRQARSDETRRLAQRIEEEFEEWQDRWEDVADRYDVKPPSHLGRLHGQKLERLERASRRDFDRTYAAIVAEHLESVVPYFQKEGQAVRPVAVRRLVNEELPLIRELLARARRLQGEASAASDRE